MGTVDKFQGRQAPVVFVSMTASSIDDVPRGIAFLLNRNRLNVAVSRAKYLSVIVRSPLLTEYLPGTPDRLIELGAFLSLRSCDTTHGVTESLTDRLAAIVGRRHVSADPDVLDGRSVDHTGRYRGHASAARTARHRRRGRRGAARLPRRGRVRHRAGRPHLAGGRDGPRARRRAAVHRAATRRR